MDTNIFRNFLSKEFGKEVYNQYLYKVQKFVESQNEKEPVVKGKELENTEIFRDMYDNLKNEDLEQLTKLMDQVVSSIVIVCKIGRRYIFVLLYFILMSFLLIELNLDERITVISLLLIGGCFLYKTYEFVINKFCFLDAHLIMIYKCVLDKLISVKSKNANSW